jgi:hypothetical protein
VKSLPARKWFGHQIVAIDPNAKSLTDTNGHAPNAHKYERKQEKDHVHEQKPSSCNFVRAAPSHYVCSIFGVI